MKDIYIVILIALISDVVTGSVNFLIMKRLFVDRYDFITNRFMDYLENLDKKNEKLERELHKLKYS